MKREDGWYKLILAIYLSPLPYLLDFLWLLCYFSTVGIILFTLSGNSIMDLFVKNCSNTFKGEPLERTLAQSPDFLTILFVRENRGRDRSTESPRSSALLWGWFASIAGNTNLLCQQISSLCFPSWWPLPLHLAWVPWCPSVGSNSMDNWGLETSKALPMPSVILATQEWVVHECMCHFLLERFFILFPRGQGYKE